MKSDNHQKSHSLFIQPQIEKFSDKDCNELSWKDLVKDKRKKLREKSVKHEDNENLQNINENNSC